MDKNTTLKVTVTMRDGYFPTGKSLSFVNVSGSALQFTDLSDNSTKNSFDLNYFSGTREYLIKGIQWGANAEGGAFGGNTAFIVMNSEWGDEPNYNDPNQGAYSISISRYRAGTAGDDTLSTDGATEQTKADEVAGLGGNDKITGTERGEAFDGGDGNDTINAGAGDDRLRGGAGTDALYGEAGNDTFITSGETSVNDLFDGGEGTDTLLVTSDVNLTGATFNSVELMQGTGQRVTVTAAQLAGFDSANNVIFSGSNQDFSALGGSYTLEGTAGDDVLKAGAGDNIIRPFAGNNTVVGGAGNDTVVWERGWGSNWDLQHRAEQVISSTTNGSNYLIQGSYAGGTGNDTLKFAFNESLYNVLGSWRWEYERPATELPFGIDLSQAKVEGFEHIELSRGNYTYAGVSYAYGPSAIYLNASQLAGLTTLSGGNFVVKGGGTVDLSAKVLTNGATISVSGDQNYTLTGTAASETLTTYGGNDSITAGDGNDTISSGSGTDNIDAGAGNDLVIIDGKGDISGNIDGGAGFDTLVLRSGDVDLSGADIHNIESIQAQSATLTMTDTQWESLGSLVIKPAGSPTQYNLKITTPDQRTELAADSVFRGLTGTEGDDHLVANASGSILIGGSGNDRLDGGIGADRLVTGAGTDSVYGGAGDDMLVVSVKTSGRDVLDGGAGRDTLVVADGQDLRQATLASLEVLQGTGTVTMTQSQLNGFEVLNGVKVQLVGATQTVQLGNPTMLNGAQIFLPNLDLQIAESRAAVLGSSFDDSITGGAGNDLILGGRGNDHLAGGAGNDTLIGGSGTDTLVGGQGDDQFEVHSSEFAAGASQQILVTGTLGQTAYFDHRQLVLYADRIDGGVGTDSLVLDFGVRNSTGYVINAGQVSGMETLALRFSDHWNMVAMDAASFKQFSNITAEHSNSAIGRYNYASLGIAGHQEDLNLDAIADNAHIRQVVLQGRFFDIDAQAFSSGPATWGDSGDGNNGLNYNHISVTDFDSILLSDGNDGLIVRGDTHFSASTGAGDDLVRVESTGTLNATLSGGDGQDVLEFTGGFVDISVSSISGFETIRHGNTTLVITESQRDALSFEGSGAKFTKVGNTIVGSASADSYSGNFVEAFQGGRGNDNIANVHTAVFTGNYNEYDIDLFTNGDSLVIEQARGDKTDGKDTLNNVRYLKFADQTIEVDDAFNNTWAFTGTNKYQLLSHKAYDKKADGNKDYATDIDVYSTTLVPNSPLLIEASSEKGSGWQMSFIDAKTGQQLQFKSLVYGWINGQFSSGMNAEAKWLPGFQTNQGFVAYQGGDVVFDIRLDSTDIQSYAFTLKYLDDYAGSIQTQGEMDPQLGLVKGYVGDVGDSDWIRTQLIEGTQYEFNLRGASSDGGTLVDPKLELRDSAGRLLLVGGQGVGTDDKIVFTANTTGTYYLSAQDVVTDLAKGTQGIALGSWTLEQRSLDMIADNPSSLGRVEWSAGNTFSVRSEINQLTDRDWFRVWLDKGITYKFELAGASSGQTLTNPQLSIRSVTGILLNADDNSGSGTDAEFAFTAVDSGWYFLDAGAAGNGSRGTYLLKGSRLSDDFAGDVHTVGTVQVGGAVQGLLSFHGDNDWFKVGLSGGVTYQIDLVGDMSDNAKLDPIGDPLLVIRDSAGRELGRFDDFGTTLNARAYFTPQDNGIYFLDASSAFRYDIGAYKLSVALAPPDDHVSTPNNAATSLTLGTASLGEIGVPGDRDMFKVSLEAGKVYQLSVAGMASSKGNLVDPYLRLFDSAGRLINFDNNGGQGTDAQMHFVPTQSGVYYIEASSNQPRGMGTYQMEVTQRDVPAADAGSNTQTWVTLKAGETFSGTLLQKNEQDWVRIRLEEGKDYVFKALASHSGNGSLKDPVLEVRSANGQLLQSEDNMLMGNEPSMLFTPTGTGDYFVVVRAADGQNDTGSYQLTTRAPDDFGNTSIKASTISLGQTLDGGIQWNDGNFGARAINSVGLATDFDQDWFKFEATQDQVLSFLVSVPGNSSLSRPMVEIVDSNMRQLAVGDGLEMLDASARATFKAPDAGTFFARVIDGAGTTGAYRVSLVAGDASDEDANGPVALAFDINAGVTSAQQVARIGLPGDTDQFGIDLKAGHSYRIETVAVRDGQHAPLAGTRLDMQFKEALQTASVKVDSNALTSNPSNFESAMFSPTADGSLSIKVSATDAIEAGQYRLRVIDLGAEQTDDRPDTVSQYLVDTHGVLGVNQPSQGRIDDSGDVDLFAVDLTAGQIYEFSIKSYLDGLGTLAQGDLRLLDAKGQLVTSGQFDTTSGRTDMAVSVFDSGRYFLAVSPIDLPGNIGTYVLDNRQLDLDSVPEDDIRADALSGMRVAPGKAATGTINHASDRDWFKANLVAGKVYTLDVLADGSGSGGFLKDANLRLLDAQGLQLAFDDNSGAGKDAHIQFSAQSTGDYFLDVGANLGELGSYTVRLRELYSGVADPYRAAQWYLDLIDLPSLDGRYSGANVSVSFIDDGVDTAHPDLNLQLDFAKAYDAQFNTKDGMHKYPILVGPPDFHGTLIAGIIGAEANNETGIVGVAQDANLVSTRVKWAWDHMTEAISTQWKFDVSNNSWGAIVPFSDNFNSTAMTFAYEGLRKGVEMGREGLGTVFVFSAGNSAALGHNTNYFNYQNAREVITVGATDASGAPAAFSTPGANVLVSAPGVGVMTTQRYGGYTEMNGTSASAPIISGVVALMLEANPDLGYRDVQKILAYATTHPDNQDWKTNGASDWNLGGMRYNDKTGFGLVDAYAAVRLAESWTEQNTAFNQVTASARAFGLNAAIPDGDGEFSRQFHIDNDLSVEHVELGIDLRHTRMGDLVVELISPNGTVSTLMNRPTASADAPFGLSGTDSGVPTRLLWDFSSVQFYGEQASGTWTVNVRDVRAEHAGSLNSLSLRLYGSEANGDSTYVFTDEGFQNSQGRTLEDEQGIDTINASPVRHGMLIDLTQGIIASQSVSHTIASWSTIENSVSGDGDDFLIGNATTNWLRAGNGQDSLEGGAGNDTLEGGEGFDTAIYQGNMAEFSVVWNATTRQIQVTDLVRTGLDEGSDVLSGIERIVFADGETNLGTMVGNRPPVANREWFSSPVTLAPGMGIELTIPSTAFSDPDPNSITDSSSGAQNDIAVAEAAGGELPDWLSYDPVTKKLSGTPPEDHQGQLKLLVTATDEFGETASDVLTLQFGDNQAPELDAPSERTLQEDAGLVALQIGSPEDPEGLEVTVKILEIPSVGEILDKAGQVVSVGRTMSADALTELHYRSIPDANGSAGMLRYEATDEDKVSAISSVRLFIQPVNDAPRFSRADGKLVINYPAQSVLPLDMARPTDPESSLNDVRITALPALGQVSLNGERVVLNQVISLQDLQNLVLSLTENVNGPIGRVGIQATDPQGLSTEWSLQLEVLGEAYSNIGTLSNDEIFGSIGNDTLYGMAGDDTLVGNAGNDRLLGGLGNDHLFGGSGDDVLDGSSGNDYLDGGTGNDTLSGGPGHDTYVVDSAGDVVLELIASGAGGKDLVMTSITYSAPANVENLQAMEGLAINLTGNELDNVLAGNAMDNTLSGGSGRDTLLGGAGNDRLDGGTEVDRMAGGAGDDSYWVDSRLDTAIELSNEGTDTVYARSSFTLPSNIENLELLEGGDWTGAGNSLNNHIKGNSDANVLAGGMGADTLEGGDGDDLYILSDNLDQIIDTGGKDTIRTSVSMTLPDMIENGELMGFADLWLNGNRFNNHLTGNMGDNILQGGAGVDTLTGGDGSDQFVMAFNGAGSAADSVTDFKAGVDLLVIDLVSFGIDPVALGLVSSGAVSSSAFVKGIGVRPLDPNDHYLLDTAQGVLRFDPDGNGAQAAVDLVKFVGVVDKDFASSDIYIAI
ncbi:S8 family serine peptidase [Limnohabitans sp. Bal53]|uniref:S8 family serine peptidase n=1 Tax=Limnohabitans sp. Bal53 TaxID=1977910 RepID=UPI001E65B77C|nr:S8 family serine peptidase [Limnohabitans sp. Bal53]